MHKSGRVTTSVAKLKIIREPRHILNSMAERLREKSTAGSQGELQSSIMCRILIYSSP